MNFDKYVNNVPYPRKKDFTEWYHYKGGNFLGKTKNNEYEDANILFGAVIEKVVDEEAYKAAREAYYREENKMMGLFADDLADELGISNHPKKDKFLHLCWQEGHSGGFSEVYNVACTWVELLES